MRTAAWETAFQITPRNCSEEARGGARIYRSFAAKSKVVGSQKIIVSSWRKTRSPLQRSLGPPAPAPDSPLFALAEEQVGQEAAPQPWLYRYWKDSRRARGGDSPD